MAGLVANSASRLATISSHGKQTPLRSPPLLIAATISVQGHSLDLPAKLTTLRRFILVLRHIR